MTTDNQKTEQTTPSGDEYPALLVIPVKEKLSRLTTAFRFITLIPIAVIMATITGAGIYDSRGSIFVFGVISLIVPLPGLSFATILMILFRQKYPRWWFDFHLEIMRFFARFTIYSSLLTDNYPSTDEDQGVILNIEYPDAQKLNRVLQLFKWIAIIPHLILFFLLTIVALVITIISWFAILITGKYPSPFFNFMTGYFRYFVRVYAYAGIFATDRYPPFSLK